MLKTHTLIKKIATYPQRLFVSFILLLWLPITGHSTTNQDSAELTVIDAFAEVRSGPGRGYPVFYAIEQGEMIQLLIRRADWYEIKSASGQIGWVTAKQISRTIQATGEPADLPSVSYGDYIKNSWWSGFSSGQFSSGEIVDSFELFFINGGYRFLTWLGAGIEFGRTYGSDSSGELYGANLYIEPFTDFKLSPFILIGTGRFSLNPQPDQISSTTETNDYNLWGLGTSYYLGRNFVVKSEFRRYSSKLNNTKEQLSAWQVGFVTFF